MSELIFKLSFTLLTLALTTHARTHNQVSRHRRGVLSRTGICPNPLINYKVKDDRLDMYGRAHIVRYMAPMKTWCQVRFFMHFMRFKTLMKKQYADKALYVFSTNATRQLARPKTCACFYGTFLNFIFTIYGLFIRECTSFLQKHRYSSTLRGMEEGWAWVT